MPLNAQQDVREVYLGIDLVCLAGGRQRVETGQVLPRGLVDDEEKVLLPQGGLSLRLRAVVVQGQALILDEAREGRPLLEGVGIGLAQRTLGWEPRRLFFKPDVQSREDGGAVQLAQLAVGDGAHHVRVARLGLHSVELEDEVLGMARFGRGGQRVEELAAAMRPAADAHPALGPRHRVVAGVCVHHERTRGASQDFLGRPARLAHAEAVTNEPLTGFALGEESPEVAQPRLLHVQHAQRRLVRPHHVCGCSALQQVLRQRQQHRGGLVEEVRQRAATHGNATALNTLGPPVQWHGVGTLRRHHMCDEVGVVRAPVYHPGWRRGGADAPAARARQHLLRVYLPLEARRHVLVHHRGAAFTQRLHVFTAAGRDLNGDAATGRAVRWRWSDCHERRTAASPIG